MSDLIADHYRGIALRLLNTAGLSAKRRGRALLSIPATAAALGYLQRATELHLNYEEVPFPYALSRREIYALIVDGTLPV